ncbi:vitamin B12 dependent-methionine synthase activation domain-containing protein [Anaerofustis sp. NSJ-163]|uniref:vitamin B12 dependent-methionine synthase activation domain-containing protein n=1 Tax=Anaerofustis sp. NSJ-163 TaxID=2944391 RepID=UPI00209C1616|nr:vitamin B12 dependent-methionine synthase activation domain-containing protein [Anaerofustis sp. NSJ-163]MCO8194479.1 Vitamin B12 dependent methionine synthase activation subunit [Anaerofustis sp. NSJ-163]
MDKITKEAIRYLGYKNNQVDNGTLNLINNSFEELKEIVSEKLIYRVFKLDITDEYIKIGQMKIKSKNLMKNLNGCDEVIVLGATLGIQVDFLIRRYSNVQMAKAVVLQACAAALLEEYLDNWQYQKQKEYEIKNRYLKARFSPGYGDFDIQHQEMLLRMLDSAKTIGLTMTQGYMLTPSKSVTALIGISKEKGSCLKQGCETCGKKDCEFRKVKG